jgi:peptidylprolyl isomerase
LRLWNALVAVLLTLALAACGHEAAQTGPGTITISGNFGAPVTITIESAPEISDLTSSVVSVGAGQVVRSGDALLLRATSFDSRTGELVSGYQTGQIRLTTANEEGVGEIASALVGVTEGSRVLVERPGLSPTDPHVVEIVVVDVLYTMAHGTRVTLPSPAPEGMPTVEESDDGGPYIVANPSHFHDLTVQPLITGSGEQVSAGDQLAIQYVVTDESGKVLDSSWSGSGPVSVALTSLMEGLQEGLVDQTVGSRVLVLIPSSEASGQGDRIAVVDILAVLPGDDSASPSAQATDG